MATKAKACSSSCLSFLKDAVLLPTRNAKLFIPILLLVALPTFLLQILGINEINNKDPSRADFPKLVKEILKQEWGVVILAIFVIISIFAMIIASLYGFAIQIVALFAASTTYSGDRHSLFELHSKVVMKGRHLTGPLITIVMVSVLNFTCQVLVAALFQLVTRHLVLLFVFEFLVFLYLDVVFVVAVAVSVADTELRGVSALRQAWRLMTRVWRKGGCLLVVLVNLLEMLPFLLYTVALGYWERSMPIGLALLSVYALLSGLVQLFNYSAATVYYYQAMEIKEVIAHDYVKIPTGEATV